MNSSAKIALLAAVALAGLLAVSAAAEKQTLSGEYLWDNGGSEVLSAEFKPDGEERWKVEFRFKFSGDDYSWNGTAEGSLEDGSTVTGTAKWSKSGRKWVFEATMEDGVLSGSHAEIRSGKEQPSGTFRLRR